MNFKPLFMKTFTLLFSTIFLLSSFSTTPFQSDTKKLMGEWKFQEVKYYRPFSFKSISEINQYESFRMIFEEENNVTYYNYANQITYQGKWKIIMETDYSSENQINETKTLEIDLKSQTPGIADTTFRLEKISISKSKIYGTSKVGKNNYVIRMNKLIE
jgi:hypothetical protein